MASLFWFSCLWSTECGKQSTMVFSTTWVVICSAVSINHSANMCQYVVHLDTHSNFGIVCLSLDLCAPKTVLNSPCGSKNAITTQDNRTELWAASDWKSTPCMGGQLQCSYHLSEVAPEDHHSVILWGPGECREHSSRCFYWIWSLLIFSGMSPNINRTRKKCTEKVKKKRQAWFNLVQEFWIAVFWLDG